MATKQNDLSRYLNENVDESVRFSRNAWQLLTTLFLRREASPPPAARSFCPYDYRCFPRSFSLIASSKNSWANLCFTVSLLRRILSLGKKYIEIVIISIALYTGGRYCPVSHVDSICHALKIEIALAYIFVTFIVLIIS